MLNKQRPQKMVFAESGALGVRSQGSGGHKKPFATILQSFNSRRPDKNCRDVNAAKEVLAKW